MLTPGKVIPLYSPNDGPLPALHLACCRWPTLSTKSSSRPISLFGGGPWLMYC
jgi:hypothetical protein